MNLNTVTEVKRPLSAEEIIEWPEGYAWLAGGTWLFSTPQVDTHTLIDLQSLRWPSLQVTADGLEIAATCTLAELAHFDAPANVAGGAPVQDVLRVTPGLIQDLERRYRRRQHLHVAAGRIDDLADGVAGRHLHVVAARRRAAHNCRCRLRHRQSRQCPAGRASCCAPSICRRARSPSASPFGAPRSRTWGAPPSSSSERRRLAPAIWCSRSRRRPSKPFQLRFDRVPDAQTLRETIFAAIPEADYFEDVHGSAVYKRHLTYYFAEQIRAELLNGAAT